MRGINDRIALVTGAGRGIGQAIAVRLAAEGAAIVVNDLDEDVAAQTVALITAQGGRAVTAPGSVTDAVTCTSMVEIADRVFGGLDIVVNNAGFTADSWITTMSDAAWADVLAVLLTGPFQVCRAAAPLLRVPRGQTPLYQRKVVNIASVNGIYGAAGQVNYSAAKAGLVGLTKALAREWAGQSVNVNAVAPGYIAGTRLTTPRTDGGTGLSIAAIASLERSMPLGRTGTPDDIAGAVAFLVSSDADYIVGQVLEVHGGQEIIAVD